MLSIDQSARRILYRALTWGSLVQFFSVLFVLQFYGSSALWFWIEDLGVKSTLHTRSLLLELAKGADLASILARSSRERLTLSDHLAELLQEKGLKRSKVVASAGINPTFGYQIFVGQRRASRDKLLALCIAMQLSLDQADDILRSGGVNELYAGDRRDAIIIYGLIHGQLMLQIQENLYRYGEEPLS